MTMTFFVVSYPHVPLLKFSFNRFSFSPVLTFMQSPSWSSTLTILNNSIMDGKNDRIAGFFILLLVVKGG